MQKHTAIQVVWLSVSALYKSVLVVHCLYIQVGTQVQSI